MISICIIMNLTYSFFWVRQTCNLPSTGEYGEGVWEFGGDNSKCIYWVRDSRQSVSECRKTVENMNDILFSE